MVTLRFIRGNVAQRLPVTKTKVIHWCRVYVVSVKLPVYSFPLWSG